MATPEMQSQMAGLVKAAKQSSLSVPGLLDDPRDSRAATPRPQFAHHPSSQTTPLASERFDSNPMFNCWVQRSETGVDTGMNGRVGISLPPSPPATPINLKPPEARSASPSSSSAVSSDDTRSTRPPGSDRSAATSLSATSARWPEASSHPSRRLYVVLTAARNLMLPPEARETARPYAILQFDQTESVTNEAGEEDNLIRTASAKRSRPKWRELKTVGGLRSPARTRNVSPTDGRTPSPGIEISSSRSRTVSSTPEAPVWNHTAQFDVIQPHPHLFVSVYDRGVKDGEEGFLGGAVVDLDLDATGQIMDDWVTLWDNEGVASVGQAHFRMDYGLLSPQSRKVSISDFDIVALIGEGSYGQVYRVKKRDTKRIYAMKVLDKREIMDRHAVQHVLAERQILAKAASPFLVGLKFSFQTADSLHLIMDLKPGGELMSYMQRYGGKFPESWVVFYTAEILSGLESLHSLNIVYRDLKPENCLLDSLGHVALCDFGLSKLDMYPDTRATTFCGTTEYIAPEILMEQPYGRSVDFWALGVLIFEMSIGWSPFYSECRNDRYNLILESDIASRIPRRGISDTTRSIIAQLLERDVTKRLGSQNGAADIKAHPFFRAVDWKALQARRITPPFKPRVESDSVIGYIDRAQLRYHSGPSTAQMSRHGSVMMDADRGRGGQAASARSNPAPVLSLDAGNGPAGSKIQDDDLEALSPNTFGDFAFSRGTPSDASGLSPPPSASSQNTPWGDGDEVAMEFSPPMFERTSSFDSRRSSEAAYYPTAWN